MVTDSPLPPPLLDMLRSTVARLGERRVREHLGLGPHAFARALAGLPVRPGTSSTVKFGLPALPLDAAPAA
jgi:hypothetical protein